MASNRIGFRITVFAILSVLLSACGSKIEKSPAKPETGKTIVEGEWEPYLLGDMDADNLPDTAYVYTSPYYETPFEGQSEEMEFAGCVNDTCYNRIKFSTGYPEIWFGNSLWGTVEPIGDLDEDGVDEFIFQTGWFIGSHVGIYIYSFDKDKKHWVVLAKNYVYGEDSYKDRITKIDKSEFKFNIEYMDAVEGDWMKKDTLIRIKKKNSAKL